MRSQKQLEVKQQQLQEMQRLESRINEINKLILEKKGLLKEIGNPEEEFATQKKRWEELHSDKVELLNSQAIEFIQLSKNLIKAEVTKNINMLSFKTQLKGIQRNTNQRRKNRGNNRAYKASGRPIRRIFSCIRRVSFTCGVKSLRGQSFQYTKNSNT